jgi:hypothetical protein
MFRYRLYLEDGSEVGEATYTQHINAGELIWAAGTRQFRVDVVPVEEEDSPYVGLLHVGDGDLMWLRTRFRMR